MPQWQRNRAAGKLALTGLVLLFVAINARWIWVYRHGLALDIDEAGYLSYALIDYFGLHYGGISGWIAAIEMPSIQAPLTMAITSVLFWVGGPHVILGFAVPLAAGAGCVAATYALGRQLGSVRMALAAALLVATCPVVVNYSRSYQFSTLAALLATLALLAMLRSRGFRSLGWAAMFGICLGLMPLARTMTIAFIPGLVAAALVVVLADPLGRLRRLLVLLGTLVLATLVAASWLWRNGLLVAQYLLGFGYGAHALEYGQKTSKFGLDAWQQMLLAFNRDVYLPHLLIVLLGVLVLVWLVVRALLRRGLAPTTRAIWQAPALPLAVFAAELVLVLTSTTNKGGGFFAPGQPALLVLTVWGLVRLGRSRPLRAAVALLVAAVALLAALPLVDLRTPLAPGWAVNIPLLGKAMMTDGRGTIQRDEARAGYGAPNAAQPIAPAASRAWVALSTQTAAWLGREFGLKAVVMFGFRNELYNVNTVNLQELLHADNAFAMRMVDPVATGESAAGYLGWLQTEGAGACALLTSDRISGDFAPAINRAFMDQAARAAGFGKLRQWPAPDGQNIVVWVPMALPENCHS